MRYQVVCKGKVVGWCEGGPGLHGRRVVFWPVPRVVGGRSDLGRLGELVNFRGGRWGAGEELVMELADLADMRG